MRRMQSGKQKILPLASILTLQKKDEIKFPEPPRTSTAIEEARQAIRRITITKKEEKPKEEKEIKNKIKV